MDQKTGEINDYIESEKATIGDGLQEIENRIKDADLKAWYLKNTPLALGAAVAGGVLLSVLFARSPSGPSIESPANRLNTQGNSTPMSPVGDMLNNAVAAFWGLATSRFQDFVSENIPGFNEQYSEAVRQRREQTEKQEV